MIYSAVFREIARRAGYSVYERSSHGPGRAWDWGPKDSGQSRHFPSEEKAWNDLERTIYVKLVEAEKLVGITADLMREIAAGAKEGGYDA